MSEGTDIEKIFKRFDTNGDGMISVAELTDALRTLGSTSTDEVKALLPEIDTDGDGRIDYEEFMAFAKANPGLIKDIARVF